MLWCRLKFWSTNSPDRPWIRICSCSCLGCEHSFALQGNWDVEIVCMQAAALLQLQHVIWLGGWKVLLANHDTAAYNRHLYSNEAWGLTAETIQGELWKVTVTFFLRGNNKMYFAVEKCINTSREVRSIQGGCTSTVGTYNTIKHFVVFGDLRTGRRESPEFCPYYLTEWSVVSNTLSWHLK